MTQIIINFGLRIPQDAYTGPLGELTADISNFNLRLHDGVTPGGHWILTRNFANQLYQTKSAELDGLLGFDPSARGFLARLGPADYRLRKITVNEGQFVLVNPNGYAGDPLISLADNIATSHTWVAQQRFNDVCQFDAGINADVAGNLTGDVEGNLVGNVTGNVTGNADGNHTGTFTGDVDLTGSTLLLDAGKIPLTAISGLLAYIRLHAFPLGGIIQWKGTHSDIPAGWALCDGTNGTLDLRDKFIMGAGDGTTGIASHSTGGTSTHTHVVGITSAGDHAHGITVADHILTESEIPSHKHGSGITDGSASSTIFTHGSFAASSADSIENNSSAGTHESWTSDVGGDEGHDHPATSDFQGAHTHATTVGNSGTLPPYYAICYIERIAD